MTRPTLPSSGQPDDFSESEGNGRHRRVPRPPSDPYRQDPQPTFTPREGYMPPPEAGRRAAYSQPATSFFVPAGYPQPSFTPHPYGEAPPRRGQQRPGEPDGRPRYVSGAG
jgi:hypothetical protein